MKIDLKADRISFQRPALRRMMVREETAEAIVPDALPDILRILDTRGTVCLRGKDSSEGRISVTATADLTVLYVPETGRGVRKLSVSVPMEITGDCPEELGDALITASLTLTGADARTVNPRKVVVRAECSCDARLYMPDTLTNTVPRETEGVYYKTASGTARLPVSVTEKTFVITDEARFREGAPAVGEILRTRTALTVESAKAVGSRAVVKGAAVTDVLYEGKEGGLFSETLTSPFSQIVETDAAGEAADFDIVLAVTSFYSTRALMDESGGDTLSLEIHAVCQCVAYADTAVERVTDAYSVKCPVEQTRGQCGAQCLTGREKLHNEAAVSVPTAERAAKVLCVTANVSGGNVRNAQEGRVAVTGLQASVLYENASGEILASSRRVEMEWKLPAGGELGAVTIAGEIQANVTDGAIELRAGLEAEAVRMEELNEAYVECLELQEEQALDKTELPSLTVVRCASPDLWALAKSHLSTEEAILEASGLAPGAVPELGTVLLVPRL